MRTAVHYILCSFPRSGHWCGGIRTDDCCRALTLDNQPIDGLYVAGTDSGSLYYSPYYDIPGYCYGLCIDSGYICAEEAAKYIQA